MKHEIWIDIPQGSELVGTKTDGDRVCIIYETNPIQMTREKNTLPAGLWRDEHTGKIGMNRCPKCGGENYYMNVLLGICAWCGYDANKDFEQQKMNKHENND